jgi:prepilin-type processing-associated H-X9-DG protein
LAYSRNDQQVFNCPAEKPDEQSYSYNPEFRGARLAAVAAPAQTILLYEGKDQKFDFRHELNGIKLTNILFADGHVKAYSPETLEAAMKDQMLQWNLEQ